VVACLVVSIRVLVEMEEVLMMLMLMMIDLRAGGVGG
jgi:hypothetical protein